MEYTVIRDSNLNELIAKVNAALANGWTPQGGIHAEAAGWFMQAITRKKPNFPPKPVT